MDGAIKTTVDVEKKRSGETLPFKILPSLRKPKKPLPLPFEVSDELKPDKRSQSPSIIPDDEIPFYDRIQALRPRFHKQLVRIWNQFKKDFLKTIPVEKTFTSVQSQFADTFLKDMEAVADVGFTEAVRIGNDYFEDQFGVTGISAAQQKRVVDRHLKTFQIKSKALFISDPELLLDQVPPDQAESVLSSFDRFLLGYANFAGSLAYDIFTRNIDLLNIAMTRLFSVAGKSIPDNPVKVRWVLLENASHSSDCSTLSLGKNGSGVWDARELFEINMLPQSSSLDCGGNCRCHLSPMLGQRKVGIAWLDKVTAVSRRTDVLDIVSDLNADQLDDLMNKKNFEIPKTIRNLIISIPAFRRKSFWNKLPDRGFRVSILRDTPDFRIVGETSTRVGPGVFLPSGPIKLQISLPRGVALNTLNVSQKLMIREHIAHELGHTFFSFDFKTGLIGTLHNKIAADELFRVANQQRAISLLGLQKRFDEIVRSIPVGKLTVLQKKDIAVMKQLINDPDEFVTKLFDAVLQGKTFGRVNADEVARLFDRAITEYASSLNITRGYQLYRIDEYFSEWFSILLTNPERAAFMNPRLNRVMAKHYPELFERKAVKRARTLLPDSIVSGFRVDLPRPTGFTPLGPNMESFAVATRNVTSQTKRVRTALVRRQVRKIIEATPGLHRQEFFEKLDIIFLDKFQVAKQSGSRAHLAFFKDGKFFINYDKWIQQSVRGRTNMLVDVVGRHIWNTQPSARQQIRQRFSAYVGGVLKFLEDKASIQFSRGIPELADIRQIVTGRNAVGELVQSRNTSFWVRNFKGFEPSIRGVTDLPIINVESLRNPQAFWLEWFKLYTIHPGHSEVYEPIMRDIVSSFITTSPIRKDILLIKDIFNKALEKQLLIEKARALFSIFGRQLVRFKGKWGLWFTSKSGGKFFRPAKVQIEGLTGFENRIPGNPNITAPIADKRAIVKLFNSLPSAVKKETKAIRISIKTPIASQGTLFGDYNSTTRVLRLFPGNARLAFKSNKIKLWTPVVFHEAGHGFFAKFFRTTVGVGTRARKTVPIIRPTQEIQKFQRLVVKKSAITPYLEKIKPLAEDLVAKNIVSRDVANTWVANESFAEIFAAWQEGRTNPVVARLFKAGFPKEVQDAFFAILRTDGIVKEFIFNEDISPIRDIFNKALEKQLLIEKSALIKS